MNSLETASMEVYDLPFCLKRISTFKAAKYLPFLPYKDDEHELPPDVEMDSDGCKL